MTKLINISKVSKILNFIDPITKKPKNHILRYWEKEFKQIKPRKINNRRYFTQRQVQIIKIIKFLIKNKGLTIAGVKNFLSNNVKKLDDHHYPSLNNINLKETLKFKSKLILNKIIKIKSHGKKNTSESQNGSRK